MLIATSTVAASFPPAALHTLGGRRATKIAPRPAAGLVGGARTPPPRARSGSVWRAAPSPIRRRDVLWSNASTYALPQQRKEAVDSLPDCVWMITPNARSVWRAECGQFRRALTGSDFDALASRSTPRK